MFEKIVVEVKTLIEQKERLKEIKKYEFLRNLQRIYLRYLILAQRQFSKALKI